MASNHPSKARDPGQACGDHAMSANCLVVNGSNNPGSLPSSRTAPHSIPWRPIPDRATPAGIEMPRPSPMAYASRAINVTNKGNMDMHRNTSAARVASGTINQQLPGSSSDHFSNYSRAVPKSEKFNNEERVDHGPSHTERSQPDGGRHSYHPQELARLESPIRSFEQMDYPETPLRRIEDIEVPAPAAEALRAPPPSPQGRLPDSPSSPSTISDLRLSRAVRNLDEIYQRMNTALAATGAGGAGGGGTPAEDALAAHLDSVRRVLAAHEQRSRAFVDARMAEQSRALDANLRRTAAELRRHTTAELTRLGVGAGAVDAEALRRLARASERTVELKERKRRKVAAAATDQRDGGGREAAEGQLELDPETEVGRQGMRTGSGDGGDGEDDICARLFRLGTPRLRAVVDGATWELEYRCGGGRERGRGLEDETRARQGSGDEMEMEMETGESDFWFVDPEDAEESL